MIQLARLDLTRWGSFTDHSLTFGVDDGRLHVVYGDNATGKSTATRATSALLFGIPHRTLDAHTHDYADLRIGALLVTEHGPAEIARRKGKSETLLGSDGQPVRDDPIAAALRGLGPDVYAGLFEISHESLVRGGRDLLAGHGAVGESLFAAAAGTGRLHRLLAALDAEADSLFKPRGRNDALNVALAKYAEAVKAMSAHTTRPGRAVELRRAAHGAFQQIDELDGELRALDEESGRLRRLKAVKPLLAHHGELIVELEALHDPPALVTDAAQHRTNAQHDHDEATRAVTATTASIGLLRDKRQRLPEPGRVLASEAAITTVHEQIAAVSKAASDRRKLEGELTREESQRDTLLGRIRPGMNAADLAAYREDQRTRRALERCLAGRGEVVERHRGATERVRELTDAVAKARADLTRSPAATDASVLRAAARAATKLGPLERQAAEQRARATALRDDVGATFARLHPRPRSIEELERSAVPTDAATQHFATLERELSDDRAAIKRDRARVEDEAVALAGRRAQLDTTGRPPTQAAVVNARGERSKRWQAVRKALVTPTEHADQFAERFEDAMGAADRIADARADQADRIAQAAELDAAAARIDAERQALADRATALQERTDAVSADWAATWASAGTPAPSIVEAMAWLTEREGICNALQAARGADTDADASETLAARHRVVMLERLVATTTAAASDASLDELIALAESRADDLDKLATRHQRAKDAVTREHDALEKAQALLTGAKSEIAAWRAEWERLRDDYRLDPELMAEDAADVLRAIDDALVADRRAAELRRRIAGIDRDRQEFVDEVENVCTAVAPKLAELGSERAAAQLMKSLGEAQGAHEAIDALDAQIAELELELAQTQERRDRAEESIAALVTGAGAASADELPAIERRATRAAELRDEIPACERQIAAAGEETFEALAAALIDVTSEQLAARLSELDRKLAALRTDRDAAQQDAFEARTALERAERSAEAAAAAETAQQHLATARRLAERYAVAKLSARLLRETIERYRAKHQGPLLARANELFPLLTCDTFSELYVDHDDAGEPILVGREAGGRRKRVEQMSDGTREQLFLALRIAAIERYVETSGAVPVLFDDVFVESDDHRAARVLAALAELATRTQVIVFTHHAHLVAIAQKTLDPTRIAVHSLESQYAPVGIGSGELAI